MFDPSVGRWLQEDPIGFDGGDPNLYRYVGNRVTTATDPSGLIDPEDVQGVDHDIISVQTPVKPGRNSYLVVRKHAGNKYETLDEARHALYVQMAEQNNKKSASPIPSQFTHHQAHDPKVYKKEVLGIEPPKPKPEPPPVDSWWDEDKYTRIGAGFQFVFSGFEFVGGVLLLVDPDPTASKVIGTALVFHGWDNFTASWTTMTTGKPTPTMTQQGISNLAQAFGMCPSDGDALGGGFNGAFGLKLVVIPKRVPGTPVAPKPATPKPAPKPVPQTPYRPPPGTVPPDADAALGRPSVVKPDPDVVHDARVVRPEPLKPLSPVAPVAPKLSIPPAGSPVVNGKTIPTLKTTGSGPRGIATSDEMAREAGTVFGRETEGWTAANKADYWEELAKQIEAVHSPAWVSSRWPGAQGEIVYLGRMVGVHGMVIKADGSILRIGKDVSVKFDINTGVITVIYPPTTPPLPIPPAKP